MRLDSDSPSFYRFHETGPNMTDSNDSGKPEVDWQRLALQARAGDRRAQEAMLELARPRLVRMALAFGAPPDDVPDLVQEVLIGAWRNFEALDPDKGSFLSWVARGLHGRVANLRRGHGRRTHFFDRWRHESEDGSEEPHSAVDARLTLAKLVGSLSPRQRDIVALYELGGLSGKETANVLGIRESAVRSIARDARKALTRTAELRTVEHRTVERRAVERPTTPRPASPPETSDRRRIAS